MSRERSLPGGKVNIFGALFPCIDVALVGIDSEGESSLEISGRKSLAMYSAGCFRVYLGPSDITWNVWLDITKGNRSLHSAIKYIQRHSFHASGEDLVPRVLDVTETPSAKSSSSSMNFCINVNDKDRVTAREVIQENRDILRSWIASNKFSTLLCLNWSGGTRDKEMLKTMVGEDMLDDLFVFRDAHSITKSLFSYLHHTQRDLFPSLCLKNVVDFMTSSRDPGDRRTTRGRSGADADTRHSAHSDARAALKALLSLLYGFRWEAPLYQERDGSARPFTEKESSRILLAARTAWKCFESQTSVILNAAIENRHAGKLERCIVENIFGINSLKELVREMQNEDDWRDFDCLSAEKESFIKRSWSNLAFNPSGVKLTEMSITREFAVGETLDFSVLEDVCDDADPAVVFNVLAESSHHGAYQDGPYIALCITEVLALIYSATHPITRYSEMMESWYTYGVNGEPINSIHRNCSFETRLKWRRDGHVGLYSTEGQRAEHVGETELGEAGVPTGSGRESALADADRVRAYLESCSETDVSSAKITQPSLGALVHTGSQDACAGAAVDYSSPSDARPDDLEKERASSSASELNAKLEEETLRHVSESLCTSSHSLVSSGQTGACTDKVHITPNSNVYHTMDTCEYLIRARNPKIVSPADIPERRECMRCGKIRMGIQKRMEKSSDK